MGRQEYKNKTETKIAEAVTVAEEALALKKDAEFAEAEKSPFKTYKGPSTYGALTFSYPKNWSAYIDETGSSKVVQGYAHPDFVPALDSDGAFALRFEIVDSGYDQVLRSFDSASKSGKVKVSAYHLPKLEDELSSRIKGEIFAKEQGEMVLLKLRDKTIKIWTEGIEYRADFDAILATLSYTP